MNLFKKTLAFYLLITLSSCSSINRFAVNTSSDLLYTSADAVQTQHQLEMMRYALPGNFLLLEGLLSVSPSNLEILGTLTKGYVAYAYGINEMDFHTFEYEHKNQNAEENLKITLQNYTKAFEFGKRYFALKNIDLNNLTSEILIARLTDSKLDLETTLYTAQSLGAMINLQKDNIALVSLLPKVKILFDFACDKKSDLAFGTCDIFKGTYEAGRPKMLGGNPEKGQEYFQKAMAKYPHNWLIRTSYIEYYLIPQGDEEGLKKELDILAPLHDEFISRQTYHPQTPEKEWEKEPYLRFYQAIAMKKFELFKRFQKELL